jgi:hypothetical protein
MSTSTHRGNSEGNNPGRFRANQPGAHSLAVRGRNFYPTPRIAVESLLAAEPDTLNPLIRIWEPAAGDGGIVAVLREFSVPVIASDIERYDGFDLHFVDDFLQCERAPVGCSVVVAQPPRQLAMQFAEHALSLVPDVFLRLAFLESAGHVGLRRALVFRRRLPGMLMAFAWMCFRRNYAGPTTLAWI